MIMIQDRIDIWNTGEYNYPAAFGFIPNLMSYLHDEDETVRPALLIIPGGGYEFVSAREGELVALEFYDRGYNCFVLTYTVDLLDAVPLRMQALEDASRAMRLIRTIAPSYYIDPNRITVLGFSAGGHLAASLCVHHQDSIEIDPRLADASARPDAAILCYPVITSGELSHPGTIRALLGFSSVDDDFVPGDETENDWYYAIKYHSHEVKTTENSQKILAEYCVIPEYDELLNNSKDV